MDVFLRAARAVEAYLHRRLTDRVGLTVPLYQLLDTLLSILRHRLRMSELAAAIGISKSRLTISPSEPRPPAWCGVKPAPSTHARSSAC